MLTLQCAYHRKSARLLLSAAADTHVRPFCFRTLSHFGAYFLSLLSSGCFGCLPSAGRPLPTHGCSSHPPALCGWHTRPMSDGSGLCAPPCALSMCLWCRHLLAQCARQPPRRRGQEAAAGCCGGQAHHTEALRGCGRWRLWGFGAFGRPRPLAPRPLPSAAQEGRDGRARA